MYEELPRVDTLWRLVTDLLIVRELSQLQLEEMLYAQLVFIYRSPQTLIGLTRRLRNEEEQLRRNTLTYGEQPPPSPPANSSTALPRSDPASSPPIRPVAEPFQRQMSSGIRQFPLSDPASSTALLHASTRSEPPASSLHSPPALTDSSLRQRSTKPKT